MIKARTRIKLLRRLGIVLIFAPELITTPFGVALVLVAHHLSKRNEASLNKRIPAMVMYYLAHTEHFNGDANGEYSAPGSAKHSAHREEYPTPQQYAGSRSFGANLDPSVWQSWLDMRRRTVHRTTDMQSLSRRYKAGDSFKIESGWSDRPSKAEKVIHHTIDMDWLCRCYGSENSAVAHSNWATASGAVEGVTHHSVNMRSLSERYKTGGIEHIEQTMVQHHTIDMESLQQRYAPTLYWMALRNPLK